MKSTEIIEAITYWTDWVANDQNRRFDIALFKIWIQFERFISDLFVDYALGIPSEKGYQPELKLKFQSEEQLGAFLRGYRTYIEYPQ